MPKRKKLTDHQYQVYKKQHNYEDVLAEEEAKIAREKAAYVQRRRKGKQQWKQQAENLLVPEAVEEVDLNLEETIATRVLRNAQTHKRRLAGLRVYEEQEADRPTDEDVCAEAKTPTEE